LFAYDSLVWKGGSALNSGDWGHINGGNAGVNNAAPPNTFVLNFGTDARGIMSPGSELVGDTVRADDAQDIIYYLFANKLNASFGATVVNPNGATAKGNYPFTPPIISGLPSQPFFGATGSLVAFQALAGGNYVAPFVVPQNTTFVMDSTKWYGGIDVRDGATLVFGPGTYRIWDFTAIGKNVTFTTDNATVINVDVHLNPNDGFRFGTAASVSAHLNIAAQTPTYDNGGPSRVTNFSHGAIVYAQYFSPSGWLDLGGMNTLYGHYWAQIISGDPNNNVTCEGFAAVQGPQGP
jgi:hypothetical protein